MKRVPIPSKGRVVLFSEKAYNGTRSVWPAVVLHVHSKPTNIDLMVLGIDTVGVAVKVRGVFYGENRPGCWWWPPRVEGTMEVED